MKPLGYDMPYAVLMPTEYICKHPEADGHLPKKGTLQPGRVVWLQHAPEIEEQNIEGFALGIGMVDLDSRLLHRV